MTIVTSDGQTFEDELAFAQNRPTDLSQGDSATPKQGQTVPKQPTVSDLDKQMAGLGRAVVDSFIPQSLKPASDETIADFHKKMSDYVKEQYVGKMDLPDIGENPEQRIARGIVDLTGMLGTGGIASGSKGALFLGLTGAKRLLGEDVANRSVATAEKMFAQHTGAIPIKALTGFEMGGDKYWRYEIGDRSSGLDLTPFKKNPNHFFTDSEGNIITNLGTVFNHPKLYKAYPEAKDIKLRFVDEFPNKDQRGVFQPHLNRITLKSQMSDEDMDRVLVHEIQHWIQNREGHPMNVPEEFDPAIRELVKGYFLERYQSEAIDKALRTQDPNLARELMEKGEGSVYRSQTSETEAFNTAHRIRMGDLERVFSPGERTEKYPRSEQIYTQHGNTALGSDILKYIRELGRKP